MLTRFRLGLILIAAGCVVAAAAPASGHARSVRRPRRPLVAHILGGSTAVGTTLGMVARIIYDNGPNGFLCSGTVVAANVILTAGHCAENETTGVVDTPGNYQVLTGSQSLSSPGQLSGVTRVIPYPAFNPSTLEGDAALLVLATPTTAPPVTLASDPTDVSLYNSGTPTVITGWGVDDSYRDLPATLQYGSSIVQSAGYCAQQAYEGASFNALDQLCAVDSPSDADGTCNGDSGGPLLALVDQTWVEIGLTSFGASNCPTALPGFFTRIDTIEGWVQGEIQQSGPAAATPSPPAAAPSAPTPPTPVAAPSQPPATPPAAESGVYSGRTTQHQPIRVHVSSSHTTVSGVHFGFHLRCTRHRAVSYTITPRLTWKLSLASGMGFSAQFHDRTGTDYQLAGAFSSTGTAAGTLTITWRTARYGRCTSGPVHWNASMQ